jgi:hypothetical protein
MSLQTRYGIYGVKVHTVADGSAAVLGGITEDSLNLGNQVSAEVTSGNVNPTVANLISGAPGGRISSRSIAAWLDAIGTQGKRIYADVSHPGLVLYGQQHQQGSSRMSGSNHRSYTITSGCLYPSRLSCEHQADALLEAMLAIIHDGTNAAIATADGIALPTNGADTARYTLGPLVLDSGTFTGVRSFALDFGNSIEADGADSDILPTAVSLLTASPSITIGGVNPLWFDSAGSTGIPAGGLCVGHANSTMYLRKRSRCTATGFVADDTAEHIAMTFAGLAYLEEVAAGQGSGRRSCNLRIQTVHDGTNLPVIIDTTAALP